MSSKPSPPTETSSVRGLLARFLYALPDSRVGHRRVAAKPVDKATGAAYHSFVTVLARNMSQWAGDPAVLFGTAAEIEMQRIEQDIENMTLAPGGALAAVSTLTEWGSKLAGAIARIAGLLHFAKYGEGGVRQPVEVETLRDAERIGDYFRQCATIVFTQMFTDTRINDAVYLLDVVDRLGEADVSERDMFTAASRSRFPTKAEMRPALNLLIEHGYLIPAKNPKPTGGRPASPRFGGHPRCRKSRRSRTRVAVRDFLWLPWLLRKG